MKEAGSSLQRARVAAGPIVPRRGALVSARRKSRSRVSRDATAFVGATQVAIRQRRYAAPAYRPADTAGSSKP